MNEETPLISPIKPQSSNKAVLKEIIILGLIALGIILPFRLFIAEPYIVSGASMDPTFKTGDYLIVDKLSYELGTPKRNTVIVFKYPNDPTKSFIKRVIGLPGETVIMEGNNVRIINKDKPQGFEVDQSYVTHPQAESFQKTLKSDEYFVMGDNRRESFDSRSWGPLQKKFILGKPILRLFPINKISVQPGKDDK
ncbi:signal peptidase I [Patescibacteria group bacterium]|nr:signal peptidase I [Patescibacteria group bacterium]